MAECLFWTFSAFEILVTVFEQVIIVTWNKLKINEVKCLSNANTVKYHYKKLQQAFRICSAVVLNIHSCTLCLLMKLNAAVTSQLQAGTS